MITFTEAAAKQVKSLMSQEPNALGLRVYVQGGGCSGFSYGFDFMSEDDSDDFTIVETNGVKLFVDSLSMMYLEDATVDYQIGLAGSMFVINNIMLALEYDIQFQINYKLHEL